MPFSNTATQNSSGVTSQRPNPGNSTQAPVSVKKSRRRKKAIRYKARQSLSDTETQDTCDTRATQRFGIARSSYYLETAPSNSALPPYYLNSDPWTPSSAYRQSAHLDNTYRMYSGTYNQTAFLDSSRSCEANRLPYSYRTTFGADRQGHDTAYRISNFDTASAHNKGATQMSFSGPTRQSAGIEGFTRMSTSGAHRQPVAQHFGSTSRTSGIARQSSRSNRAIPLSTIGDYRQFDHFDGTIGMPTVGAARQPSRNNTGIRTTSSDDEWLSNFNRATRISSSGATLQTSTSEATSQTSISGTPGRPFHFDRATGKWTYGAVRQSPSSGASTQTSTSNSQTPTSGSSNQTSTNGASSQASISGATSQTSISDTTWRTGHFDRATGKWTYGAVRQSPSSGTSPQTSTSNSQMPTSGSSNQTSTNGASSHASISGATSQTSTSGTTSQTSTSGTTWRKGHFDRATGKWTYVAVRQSPSSGTTPQTSTSNSQTSTSDQTSTNRASSQASTSRASSRTSPSGTTERTIEFDRATGKWTYGATKQSPSSGTNNQASTSGDIPQTSTSGDTPQTSTSGATERTIEFDRVTGKWAFNYTIPLRPPDEFTPLRFRLNDGSSYVDISEDGSIARLNISPYIHEDLEGDALSARPIRINERVCFRILENPTDSDAFINFGVAFYPENQRDSTNGDLDYWSCPGYCTHNKIGNVVYFYVSSAGRLHYGVNGEESGVVNCKVNMSSPNWAWIEFFGNGAVELVSNPIPEENQRACPNQSHVDPVLQFRQSTSLLPLNLHTIKGANVQISSGVITRTQADIPQAYVFTAIPMSPGQTIIVQILSTVSGHHENFAYGLTSCDPSTIRPSELPDEAYFLHDRPEYWTVHKAEGALQVLDQVTFTLTAHDRVLERQNNSSPKTVMHVDAAHSLWAFVDLCGAVQEVRLLTCTGAIPTLPRLVASEPDSPGASSEPGCLEASSSGTPQQSSSEASEVAEEERDSVECTVCFDNAVDSALYKCGHSCMCYTCALQLRHDGGGKCPLCRAKIVDVIRIFKS